MYVTPMQFLVFICAITAAAAAAQGIKNALRRRQMCAVARQWGMQFVPDDRFRLAERIGDRLPVVGAADLRVEDLMYQTQGGRRRYLFTVEYGVGVVHGQTRRQNVMGFEELVSGAGEILALRIAPDHLPLCEQYQWVHEAHG
jgi:hypothetical protein